MKFINKLRIIFFQIRHNLLAKKLSINFPIELRGTKNIRFGNNVRLGKYGSLKAWTKYRSQSFDPKIIIGDDVSIGNFFHISSINEIEIKKGTLIGFNLTIIDNFHGDNSVKEFDISPAKRRLYSKGIVKIGKNVWIGDKVTIMPGVSIGDGCIIGSNSVVTKSFEKNLIIGGVPAKIIKKIKDE